MTRLSKSLFKENSLLMILSLEILLMESRLFQSRLTKRRLDSSTH